MKDKKITVIYASTSGNVEMVVDYVANVLRETGVIVNLHRAEATDDSVLLNNDLFILATSTWGHGVLNPFFDDMLINIKDNNMSGKRTAFIGLGDTRYDEAHFCEGIKIVNKAFLKSNGTEIHRMLKINGEPHKFMDLLVKKWAKDLIEVLNDKQN